jgi:peptidyl-tRNA hydrolase
MQSSSTEKKKRRKWDKASLKKVADLYSSRSEFAYSNKPAYEAARLLGLLDEWFGYKLNQWSESAVIEESKKYTSRTEFAKKSGAAYNAARRLGIIDSLFDSMLKTWDRQNIEKVAVNCENKKQLKRKCASAYNAALRLGIIDELFENQTCINTRDCVYLWAVKDEPGLYKFGITSYEMKDYRIHQVAREAKVDPEIIFIRQVGYEAAKRIELKMKKLGQPYKFSKKFYGHSEFRYMSPDEVKQCVDLSKGV